MWIDLNNAIFNGKNTLRVRWGQAGVISSGGRECRLRLFRK
ncbi:hypothetical protein A676_01904 [Salmonella enterica subsp. enterica serovar Enteritidis str. 2010K-0262]|uniref:Uncharacterized protein n=1 Tax=Salmonella enteritidis (strain 2009K0958) TaxID=1192586 RepID=A0A656ICY4_SALE2|nr:hypothetical protein A673_04018 [Salmonella enterica subsp. enterica serovar Enteritidis str. 2009K0958]EPI78696.1 hypothetical protein A675_04879 [Salmonella enterica subsp. enterica serovar Enteritidis str. 2009K1726]EPI83781.1 hypothetical protein A676_01904 [Salmonella enterica subsp. enterica serovar Enteritidis str. 2010K-0262]EPI89639.1 hypothetical protein A674_00827 [Salmonella enterica subsp. enterica serovar Enteritidis str. 2009K1651]EPI97351.1 hypothetical protein A678_03787 [Sa